VLAVSDLGAVDFASKVFRDLADQDLAESHTSVSGIVTKNAGIV
jgi:hypothetical protein